MNPAVYKELSIIPFPESSARRIVSSIQSKFSCYILYAFMWRNCYILTTYTIKVADLFTTFSSCTLRPVLLTGITMIVVGYTMQLTRQLKCKWTNIAALIVHTPLLNSIFFRSHKMGFRNPLLVLGPLPNAPADAVWMQGDFPLLNVIMGTLNALYNVSLREHSRILIVFWNVPWELRSRHAVSGNHALRQQR